MSITATKTHNEQQTTAPHGPGEPVPGTHPGLLGRPTRTRPRARHELVDQPVERLEAEVIELSGRLAAGTYELLVLVGELDQRGSWATWGALSCAAWLADTCDIDVSTARSQVRVARAMRHYPQLDAVMAAGDVSYSKARVLVPYLTDDNVDDLLAIAERTPAGHLGAAVAAWSQRHDDADQIRDRQHRARSVSWRTEPDGMVVITARLIPETAGAVCATVDTVVTRATAPAGASLGQQRADALVAVITSGVQAGSPAEGHVQAGSGVQAGVGVHGGVQAGPGFQHRTGAQADSGAQIAPGVQAEMVIHVTEDGNHLTDGTPLSDHAVTALLPEAFVSLLMHDAQRQPIDASPRRRNPTRRQRRVLDQRHPECQHPGCHAEVFLEYDHIQPYSHGGPTVITNLQRLCGPHNRARQAQ